MKLWFSIRLFYVLLLTILYMACSDEDILIGTPFNEPGDVPTNYKYSTPTAGDDGLEVSDLRDEGLDLLLISTMMDSIDAGAFGSFHSILIFKNDKLVLDEYFNELGPEDLLPVFSITKSIASAVVGLAIEEGYIEGVHEPVYQLIPEQTEEVWTEEKKAITLEYFLSMSSGFKWNELSTSYSDPSNSHYQMIMTDDWIKFVLELPLVRIPGTDFNYNTGTSNLLSVIVRHATGQRFDDFANTYLLSVLGINHYSWRYLKGDYAATGGSYGGLHLKSRDIGKFGMLYLNEGKWNGKQVISAEWVAQSISQSIHVTGNRSFTYGYQWWRKEQVRGKNDKILSIPYAVGAGGQYIFLVNEYDMLIIMTSPYSNSNHKTQDIFRLLEDYILASVM